MAKGVWKTLAATVLFGALSSGCLAPHQQVSHVRFLGKEIYQAERPPAQLVPSQTNQSEESLTNFETNRLAIGYHSAPEERIKAYVQDAQREEAMRLALRDSFSPAPTPRSLQPTFTLLEFRFGSRPKPSERTYEEFFSGTYTGK